jgi:hypothetical protein
VQITRSALDKLQIYSAIGVAEVWLYDGDTLRAYHLQSDGSHLEAGRSNSFPLLPLRDVADFLKRYRSTDETAWIREVREWVRKLRS